jgi:hypothetical protein
MAALAERRPLRQQALFFRFFDRADAAKPFDPAREAMAYALPFATRGAQAKQRALEPWPGPSGAWPG